MYPNFSITLGILWLLLSEQVHAGKWLFKTDKIRSKIDMTLTGTINDSSQTDRASTRILGTMIAEITPDTSPTETIHVTNFDARTTNKNIKFNFEFGPFGIFGTAKFYVKNLRIILDPSNVGEATEVDNNGNFIQEGNLGTFSGIAANDITFLGVNQKNEIDLANPDNDPDGFQPEPFNIDGKLTWDNDVPILQFDFDFEEIITDEGNEDFTGFFTFKGKVVARGERMTGPPQINIANKTPAPFNFSFKTVEGSTYEVQASGDLNKWSPLQNINGTGNEVKVFDSRKAIFQRQFYRVKMIE